MKASVRYALMHSLLFSYGPVDGLTFGASLTWPLEGLQFHFWTIETNYNQLHFVH